MMLPIVPASEAALAQEVPANLALQHLKLALVSLSILAVSVLLTAFQWVIRPILSASQVVVALVVPANMTAQHM